MEDAKQVGGHLFNAEDYKNLTVKLSITNLTAKTQVSDVKVVRKQINSSLVIGNTRALEFLECTDATIVVGSTIQIGALGHDVEVRITVFSDEEETRKLLAFKSRCKITMFERKSVEKKSEADRDLYFIHYTFQKGDQKYWKQFSELMNSKQQDINKMFAMFRDG